MIPILTQCMGTLTVCGLQCDNMLGRNRFLETQFVKCIFTTEMESNKCTSAISPNSFTTCFSTLTPPESICLPIYDFGVMVWDIVEILQRNNVNLERLLFIFEQMASALKSVTYTAIIKSKEYRNVNSVQALFRLLAPHWNPVDCSLLVALVNATRCTEAIQRLKDYLISRSETKRNVVLGKDTDVPAVITAGVDVTFSVPVFQQPSPNGSAPSQTHGTMPVGSDESNHSPPHTVDSGSLHLLLPPNQAPEHNTAGSHSGTDRDSLQITAKFDEEQITWPEYDHKTAFLCGILRLPRFILQYTGVEPGCVAIKWITSDGLLSHILSNALDDGDLQLLLDEKIISVQVGSDYTITVGSQRYWRVSTIKPLSIIAIM